MFEGHLRKANIRHFQRCCLRLLISSNWTLGGSFLKFKILCIFVYIFLNKIEAIYVFKKAEFGFYFFTYTKDIIVIESKTLCRVFRVNICLPISPAIPYRELQLKEKD